MKKTSASRIDCWKKVREIPVFFFDEKFDEIPDSLKEIIPKREHKLTHFDLIFMCKELIFNIVEGEPIFHCIAYSIDSKTFCLKLGHHWDILVNSDDSDETRELIKNTIAMAISAEVPIFPNTSKVEKALGEYYKDLIINGFTAPSEAGDEVRLALVDSPKEKVTELSHLLDLDLTQLHSSAELSIIKEAARFEFSKLNQAQKVLADLQVAINDLNKNLTNERRNENSLQMCLTNNPILFGLDYLRIIPKHKLGSEYEVDYALEKISGSIDVVEIEASNLPLFNNSEDPSFHLVHAEQQVLDWIEWIEQNSPYARNKLQGLKSPEGYVVIGRSSGLNEQTKIKLNRRNLTFRGTITILTYDDILIRAQSILDILCKKPT